MTTSELQQRIRDAWTRGAPYYDHDPGHGLLSAKAEDAWAQALRETLGDAPRFTIPAAAKCSSCPANRRR